MFHVIDLFCGFGGMTYGFHQAKDRYGNPCAIVKIAVNHDAMAIQCHKANHQETIHVVEDIRNWNIDGVKVSGGPGIYILLHASAECTNFSIAKGGMSRDADSRTLPEHLLRYIKHFQPHYMTFENVKEFKVWGPLIQKRNKVGELMFDKKGRPVLYPDPAHLGEYYRRWLRSIGKLGYRYEVRILDAANYGAHTSRKRLFIIFAKDNLPIAWPEATHHKTGGLTGLPKWKPVRECLDFRDKGYSIFEDPITGKRENGEPALCDNTKKRILAGLQKFVANGDKAWLVKYYSAKSNTDVNEGCSINVVAPTITTHGAGALVQPEFLTERDRQFLTGLKRLDAVATEEDKFLMKWNSASVSGNMDNTVTSVNEPCPTVCTQNRLGIVSTDFLMGYYKSGENIHSIDEPCDTITTKDRFAKVSAQFIDLQHGNGKQHQSINEPLTTIMTVPKKNLITCEGWVMDTNYNNSGRGLDEPAGPLLASRRHYYLMNPQYLDKGSSVDAPCFTLIARMDKKPPYLIEAEAGRIGIEIYETDSEYTRQIKAFMAYYGITNIHMRMLKVSELLKIQGFPESYANRGNTTEQKKWIGNSVCPNVARAMAEALDMALYEIDSSVSERVR